MKSLFASSAVLALFASAAHAQTYIRIVASNGDRNATQTAISKILAPGWKFHGNQPIIQDPGVGGNISAATGSNWGVWNGTYNGTPVVIKVTYAGALAGVAAAAGQQNTWRFVVPDGTAAVGTTGPGSVGLPDPLIGTSEGTDYQLGTANFGFSTNFQSTSPFNGYYNGVTYEQVEEVIVGVSPLGFYASPGFPAGSANITTQLAQQLYTTGSVSLAQFTGNFTADENKIVWAIGRNTDAGQRYGAYTEVGLGTTSTVTVWDPRRVGSDTTTGITGQTTTSGITYGGTVQTHRLWPEESPSGVFSPEGSGGFSSGANLAPFLTVVLGPNAYKGRFAVGSNFQFLYPNATAGYYIGYLTPGDASTRVLGSNGVIPEASRGVALSYNGVALTDDNVRSGKYTAWLYNRLLKPSSLVGFEETFADALANQIATVDAPAGGGLFNDGTFRVQRFTDGGLVVPK